MGLKPTCKEIHRLTSESFDRELTLIERARMGVHLLVCHACQNFGAQMELIRRAMRTLNMSDGAGQDRESQ